MTLDDVKKLIAERDIQSIDLKYADLDANATFNAANASAESGNGSHTLP